MIQIQKFCFNPFGENTYVVVNEKKAILIDPGNYTIGETQLLENFINKNHLEIERILLTHAHIDHVLGLQWACDTYNLPAELHENEIEILERLEQTGAMYGFKVNAFQGNKKLIQDNQVITLGDKEFVALSTPGHSPGSLSFYDEKNNLVISGDALFKGSIGRTDLYKGDLEQLINAIQTRLFTLKDETVVYCGHGDETTIGLEKLHNPYFQ